LPPTFIVVVKTGNTQPSVLDRRIETKMGCKGEPVCFCQRFKETADGRYYEMIKFALAQQVNMPIPGQNCYGVRMPFDHGRALA